MQFLFVYFETGYDKNMLNFPKILPNNGQFHYAPSFWLTMFNNDDDDDE